MAVQRTREVEDDSEETEVMKVTTYNGGAWVANERHLAMLGGEWADRGVVLVQEHKLVGEDATKEKAEKLRGAAWNSIWGATPPPTIGPRGKPGASSGRARRLQSVVASARHIIISRPDAATPTAERASTCTERLTAPTE